MGRRPKYDEPTSPVGMRLPVSIVELLKASGRPPGEVAAELVIAGLAEASGRVVAAPTAAPPSREREASAGARPRAASSTSSTRTVASRGPTRGINVGDTTPSNSSCPHPIGRRIGTYCAACGRDVKGSSS